MAAEDYFDLSQLDDFDFMYQNNESLNEQNWEDSHYRKIKSKTMKIKNKFYVGSRSMIDGSRNDWGHNTLEKAINHAKQLCEETDEEQIVVQIIRLVKREKKPVIVEKI